MTSSSEGTTMPISIRGRMTAILSGVGALLAALLQAIQAGATDPPALLLALGAGIAAYLVAFQTDGLAAKIALGAVVSALGSVAAGIDAGRSAAEIGLTAALVILSAIGVASALPSTQGSVARDATASQYDGTDSDSLA